MMKPFSINRLPIALSGKSMLMKYQLSLSQASYPAVSHWTRCFSLSHEAAFNP